MNEQRRRPSYDPRKPLPGEIPSGKRLKFLLVAAAILFFGLGLVAGLASAPTTQNETEQELQATKAELKRVTAKVAELERTLAYKGNERSINQHQGKLKPEDKARMIAHGQAYARALRGEKAQSAAELVNWFVDRWTTLLDYPEANDRIERRADTLSRLVGSMAAHINPKDYVPWQAEFFDGGWLGDLHYDLDGDGFPGKRASRNPKDGFTNVSICQIAMALNLSATDVRILMMPSMQCDRTEARLTVFLQGSTVDQAVTEFAQAARRKGFIVVERQQHGTRLLLLGTKE